jgi:hypothetical protein
MNKLVIAGTLAVVLSQSLANAADGIENSAVNAQASLLGRFNPFGYAAHVLPLDSAAAMGDGIIVGTANGAAVA